MGLLEALNETRIEATDAGESYLKCLFKYVELKVFQQLSLIISDVVKLVAFGSLALLSLLFFAIGLAIFLSEFFEDAALGFFLVGFLFVFIIGITFLFKHRIERAVIRKLSKNFFD
ncbi:hypothetical protein [uncultured Winogradskyella sp.]|uniref:hypothetical protein n=1 Tax=uncultured Winogradskyella sp. TaxID=395353 RepID=UPI003516D660